MKILFVIDRPAWAYDVIADFIIEELGSDFNFFKLYSPLLRIDQPTISSLSKSLLKQTLNSAFFGLPFRRKNIITVNELDHHVFDLTIFFWWETLNSFYSPKIKTKYSLCGLYTENFPYNSNTLFYSTKKIFFEKISTDANGVLCGNNYILDDFRANCSHKTAYYAPGCVNTRIFSNKKNYEMLDFEKQFRIGWSGTPTRKFKGYHKYVVKIANRLTKDNPCVSFIPRFKGPVSTLPNYYSKIDLMINASIGDAGPAFIGDAGACGTPTISNFSGIAREVIEHNKTGLIVDLKEDEYVAQISKLIMDKERYCYLSKNISGYIKDNFSPSRISTHWKNIFLKYKTL